jgi:hypothetical protein
LHFNLNYPAQANCGLIFRDALDMDRPVIQLHHPDGRVWKIWENGRYEGFPDGTFIMNSIPSRIAQAIFQSQQSGIGEIHAPTSALIAN